VHAVVCVKFACVCMCEWVGDTYVCVCLGVSVLVLVKFACVRGCECVGVSTREREEEASEKE